MTQIASEAAATEGNVRHVTEMIQEAVPLMVGKYLDTEAGALRIIDHGTEVVNDVRDAVRDIIRKHGTPNQFASEEVVSNWIYPAEYKGPKPIREQVNTLGQMFDLDQRITLAYLDTKIGKLMSPEDAEGWFAVPSVAALARVHFTKIIDPVEQYVRSVNLTLDKIKELRKFYNYCEGQLTADRLRQSARTLATLAKLSEMQGHPDILVVPAQFGLRHRGRSVRRAREVFVRSEFGLGALSVGSMVLIHPECLVRWQQLYMDCAGDEFDEPDSDVRFDRSPCFHWSDGKVRFGARTTGYAGGRYGSASAFVPQA